MTRRGVMWSLRLIAALLVTHCGSDSTLTELFDDPPTGRFRVTEDPLFGPLEPAASAVVLAAGLGAEPHHFCVVGYTFDSGDKIAWVHWEEQERLILWEGSRFPESRAEGLATSRRNLSLQNDTVESPNEIAGSSYLVTRQWWQAMVRDCEEYGERLELPPIAANASAEITGR